MKANGFIPRCRPASCTLRKMYLYTQQQLRMTRRSNDPRGDEGVLLPVETRCLFRGLGWLIPLLAIRTCRRMRERCSAVFRGADVPSRLGHDNIQHGTCHSAKKQSSHSQTTLKRPRCVHRNRHYLRKTAQPGYRCTLTLDRIHSQPDGNDLPSGCGLPPDEQCKENDARNENCESHGRKTRIYLLPVAATGRRDDQGYPHEGEFRQTP